MVFRDVATENTVVFSDMANLDAMGIKLHFCWGGRVFLTGGAVSDAPVCCCVGECGCDKSSF